MGAILSVPLTENHYNVYFVDQPSNINRVINNNRLFNFFSQLKCHKYWPDDSKQYGDILVTLREREFFSDFTVRVFKLENVSKDEVYFHSLLLTVLF